MSVSRFAILLALLLPACGDSSKGDGPPVSPPPAPPLPAAGSMDSGAGPSLEGAAGARAAVDGYFGAARKADLEGMLKYGTAEWRTKETTAPRRFSPAIAKKEITLKTARIDEPVLEGDTAKVRVGAVFVDAKGRDDKEGMHFTLIRKDARWWITDLE